MLVFWKEKLVLLAVPKTGTTAIERALAPHASLAILDPPGLKHISARRYRADLEPLVTRRGAEPHEIVALIREPVDWLGSWFRYRQRPELDGMPASTAGIDFDGFVEAWLSERPPAFARVGSQATFLCGGRGKLLVRHLFAYEDHDRFTGFLEGRLGRTIRLDRANVSPAMGLALSAPLEARLREAAARDFALWETARAGSTG
ncbi:gamma-glutamyl kinase [Rhodobacterales bacterium HKCCE3408]|nr:gamma-glutamyl kinase [Rhodobacterales bacterium HKCCE3408]